MKIDVKIELLFVLLHAKIYNFSGELFFYVFNGKSASNSRESEVTTFHYSK